ncbi:MAG: hypothetical protein ACE5KE_00395 [Methanosarcinales archaeon]
MKKKYNYIRKTISFDKKVYNKITNYRKKGKDIKTFSRAVNELIKKARVR